MPTEESQVGWLYGLLGLGESASYATVNEIGQVVVYDATQLYLAEVEAQIRLMSQIFIEEVTTVHQERYFLPGGGKMQRRGGLSQSAAVKPTGKWDVAYPLYNFGDQLAEDTEELAYMSPQEYQRNIDTIAIRATNSLRDEVLGRILNNTMYVYGDKKYGSLNIQPLANGDTVLYPPAVGKSISETLNNYLATTYGADDIEDGANNPYTAIYNQLSLHTSGRMKNGIVFINKAQKDATEALIAFKGVDDSFIQVGIGESKLVDLPDLPQTATIIGRVSGLWVAVWDYIPPNYMVATDMNSPAPLKRRVDPPNTNLPSELRLVAKQDRYPLEQAHFAWRFGIGTGNRLNGVVLQLKGSAGNYEIPSDYEVIG